MASPLQSKVPMRHTPFPPAGGATMKTHGYSYQSALEASERIDWRVEDLIGGDKTLDFSKPFMPESFARVEPLTFLSPRERLALNQIDRKSTRLNSSHLGI